jgi:hypothetical protein
MDVSKTGMPLPGQVPAGEKTQKGDHGSGQAKDGVNFESILSGEIHTDPCDVPYRGKIVSPPSGAAAGPAPERGRVVPEIDAPAIEEILRPAAEENPLADRRKTLPEIDAGTMAILEERFGGMLIEGAVPGIPDSEPAEGVGPVDESPGRRLLEGFVRLKMDIDGFRPGGPEKSPETGPDDKGKSGDFAARTQEAVTLVFGDLPQRDISNLSNLNEETSAPTIANESSAPVIGRISHETASGSKTGPGYSGEEVEMAEVRKFLMKAEQSGISFKDVELKTAARNAYLGTKVNVPAENPEEGSLRGNVSRQVLPSGIESSRVVDQIPAASPKTGAGPVPGNSEKTPGVSSVLEGFREKDTVETRNMTRAKENDPLRSEAGEFSVPVAGSRDPLGQVERFSPAVVGESLARFVEVIRDRKGHSGTLELDPPELGRLRITLESTRDSLNLHLVVEKSHSRSMIEDSLGALRDSLARQGISLGETTVDVGGHAPQGGGSSRWVPGEQGGIPLTGAVEAEEVTEQEQVVARLDIERGLFHWIA